MLTHEEQSRVVKDMCVYEHEWRYLAGYLGEPFLLDDVLCFYDGRALNVCVFTLGSAKTLSSDELKSRLAILDKEIQPRLVHVWGDVFTPANIEVGRVKLRRVVQAEAKFPGEYSLDLANVPGAYSAEVMKAIRSFRRDNLQFTVDASTRLSWRELALIERWQERISPGIAGTVAGASIAGYVLSSSSYTVRCFIDHRLVGFSVFSRPTAERAVNLMSFAERLRGVKIEDGLVYSTIQTCRSQNVRWLHLGYAGTDSLGRFKQKWGATKTGADYTQAIYVDGQDWEKCAQDFTFYWWARLLGHRFGIGATC